MIAASIVAILAVIALPSYQSQIRKTHRADAKEGLVRIGQQLERCYARYRRFDSTDCPLVSSGRTVSVPSENGHYQISTVDPDGAETLTADTFLLFATATGDQALDTQCIRFRVNNHLARTASNASGVDTTHQCW